VATFVLVHGAWHGGWCWSKVAPLLRRTGAEVYTPTLSGLGERAHLAELVDQTQVDLELHIQDVTRLMEYEGLDDVVLVGHAYAGMVITGVAEVWPERLSHLVYINGVIPADGESMADQLIPVRGPDFAAWVRDHIKRGEGYLPPPASPEELGRRWGIPDAADREWMFDRVTPQPAAAMAGPVSIGNPAARDIPRSFIGGEEAGFQPVADRAREAGWGIYHLDSGHDPMVSHPRELAEILLGIAASF
jgi:pimeloyl-ACP methyl ester carboxylesterase